MKKSVYYGLFFLISILFAYSCSSDDNPTATTSPTSEKISPPSWLIGSTLSSPSWNPPYPKTGPYAISISQNDIMIKGLIDSPYESLQNKINELAESERLVSVTQFNAPQTDAYILSIEYKNTNASLPNGLIRYAFNNYGYRISVSYYYIDESGTLFMDIDRDYTKQ